MADDECGNCRKPFTKSADGHYNRILVGNNYINKTIKEHFSDLGIPVNSKFVSHSCYKSIRGLISVKDNPDFGNVSVKKKNTHQKCSPSPSTSRAKRTRTPQQVFNIILSLLQP